MGIQNPYCPAPDQQLQLNKQTISFEFSTNYIRIDAHMYT